MENAVDVQSLCKKYGDHLAVDALTLQLPHGEVFGLLGPNGSGKTTTIKMLTGQIKPTSGTALVLGIDASKDPIRVRELVGIIPEQESPPSFLTAEEYLYFVGSIRKLDGIHQKVEWWARLLDFEDQRKYLCKDLSRGTRQKLMFSQAFLHEPKLAFIDEPLVNLDPVSQKAVKEYIRAYAKKGNTIFFSTHTLEIAEEICDSFAILIKGKLIHSGKISDLKKKKKHLEAVFLDTVKNA